MSQASGVAKISGEAVAAARAALDAGADLAADAQPDLLGEDGADLSASETHMGLPDAGEIMDLQAELGCDIHAAIRAHRQGKRGGRKPGAKNRRSADLVRYLSQFGPDPAVGLMRIQARPVHLLAAELGCTPLEALDRQLRAKAELMPYFHGKKPQDINLHAHGHMTIEFTGTDPALDGGDLLAVPDLPEHIGIADAETAENRQFSDERQGQSE